MDSVAHLRASFVPLLGNAETAIKCFAVIRPFLKKQFGPEFESLNDYPAIVDVITDKVLRYGVLALSRLWDTTRGTKSIPNLMSAIGKQYADDSFAALLNRDVLEARDSELATRLRIFRNKFLAHTEGAQSDPSMEFTPEEIEGFLVKTLELVDRIQFVLHELSFESMVRYNSYSEDALYDWCKLLNIEVPKHDVSSFEDFLLLDDGD